jgi:Ca2+-transporting ATPase
LPEFYQISIEEISKQLSTSFHEGLSTQEADRRLEQYGANELVERAGKSPWKILLEQFTATMVVVLLIAGVISLVLGEYIDAGAIFIIVLLNAALGFSQEYRAEQAMAALKKMAVPTVKVRRDSHVDEISARELVPGDVVLLEVGNLVPADCRLVESVNLRIDESALTGESVPVEKDAKFISDYDIPLGDRHNMAYMGTVITYGRGEAIVADTGMETELGNIATLIQRASDEQTPLQRRLDQLGKALAWAAMLVVVIIFVLGLLQGGDLEEMFLTAISMAVAAIPEGLPAVVTIALALGAQRMLRREALIRKLPAVEGLGSVTVICSDKTGTLTENRMTVIVLDVAGHKVDLIEDLRRGPEKVIKGPDEAEIELMCRYPALTLLLAGGALCNDAVLEIDGNNLRIVGDPTEGALLVAAARAGLTKEKLDSTFPRQAEVPFDSERKRMATMHSFPETQAEIPTTFGSVWDWEGWPGRFDYVVFAKGAVNSLLEICDRVWVDDHVEEMDEEWCQRIDEADNELAKNGVRVLGVACKSQDVLPEEDHEEELEKELIFVGLVGMIDPARPEVKEAVATCKTAGIRPIMITGDHPLTARYIAEELGIADNGSILTGQDLAGMTLEDLEEVVADVSVYARVSPEHKLKIVESLQNRGQIAAMTGDGVNDAPALKKSDIGVAMGITGTDVSKEAADMVLLDDNFTTIVNAIEEGRTIYDNIRRFIKYTLTSNAGEIWVMVLAPFLGMPLPLVPLQILWINLVTDGLPGLAMTVEPAERDVMTRPPYKPDESVFSRGVGRQILLYGFLMGLVSLAVGYYFWSMGHPYWRTIVFTTITLSQMGNALAIRSNRDSLFRIGLLSNKAMLGAVLLTLVTQLAVVYIPFLQSLFKTGPLTAPELVLCLLLSTVVFWAIEIEKWVMRLRRKRAASTSMVGMG